MVREILEDLYHWLENSVSDSVNHSFVAAIFRIDLMGMRGIGALDF